MRSAIVLTVVLGACTPFLSAQRGDSGRFEAASVKINKTEVPLRLMIGPANRVYATRVDLRQVIWTAYGVDRLQVVGGPDWMETARFDIDAVAPIRGDDGVATAAFGL